MKKIISTIALLVCLISTYGQRAVPDTIYIYETVIIYDTIIIHDTVRIKKATDIPTIHPIIVNANIFSSQTATFSKNGVIYKNNIKNNDDHNKTKEMKEFKKFKELKLSILNYASAAILAAHTFSGISAQEKSPTVEEEQLPTKPLQFSIVYPMTSMGNQTKDYCFQTSFNLFYGKVGSVKGVEFGSLLNHVERNMTGVQFGGIGNITHKMNGVQFGGIFNIASDAKGVQFGGITNITEDVNGVQFAGITNIAKDVNGIMFAGIANMTKNVTGIQFGGIGNISEEVTGIQFGGIFNYTETLRGLQFAGIVNVADTIEHGASIALINIVRKGFYRAWELSFADYMNAGVSFKMGTQKFYTIFSAGATFMEDNLWVAGIGFGNRTTLGARFDFQPEIITYRYFPFELRHYRDTHSSHIKLGIIYKVNDRFGISVAPSIYHSHSHINKNGDYYKISPVAPFYENHKTEHNSHVMNLGAGISIGLIFK